MLLSAIKYLENYLDNLEAYLDEESKAEVREEYESIIRAKIDDEQHRLNRELTSDEFENLLLDLGHPMKVAAACSQTQAVISDEYYPLYRKFLTLALVLVSLITLISNIGFIFSAANFIRIGIGLTADFIENCVWTFTAITLLFWLLQDNQVKVDALYKWRPSDLRGKNSRLAVSRVESLFEICVYLIFLAWWNELGNNDTGGWLDNLETPIKLSDQWNTVFWSINIIIGLSLIVDATKYLMAGWSKPMLIANVALSLAALAVLIQIALFDRWVVLNPDMLSADIINTSIEHAQSAVLSIIAFIGMITLWDIYDSCRKFFV